MSGPGALGAAVGLLLAFAPAALAAGWSTPLPIQGSGDAGNATIISQGIAQGLLVWDDYSSGSPAVEIERVSPTRASAPQTLSTSVPAFDSTGASDGAGDAVVVWTDSGPYSGSDEVRWVDVNADGTIAAPGAIKGSAAANGPVSVARDPSGDTLVAWWAQADSVHESLLASWRPAGGSFEPAVDVTGGLASTMISQPAIAIGPDGEAAIAWMGRDPASGAQEATVARGAVDGGWTAPQALSSPDVTAEFPQVAVGPGGATLVAWRESTSLDPIEGPYGYVDPVTEDQRVKAAIAPADAGFQAPVDLGETYYQDAPAYVGVGPDGGAVVAFANYVGPTAQLRVVTGSLSDASFGPPQDLGSTAVESSAFAMNAGGQATLASTAQCSPCQDAGSYSRSAAGAFADRQALACPAVPFGELVDMTLDPLGNPMLVWYAYVDNGGQTLQRGAPVVSFQTADDATLPADCSPPPADPPVVDAAPPTFNLPAPPILAGTAPATATTTPPPPTLQLTVGPTAAIVAGRLRLTVRCDTACSYRLTTTGAPRQAVVSTAGELTAARGRMASIKLTATAVRGLPHRLARHRAATVRVTATAWTETGARATVTRVVRVASATLAANR